MKTRRDFITYAALGVGAAVFTPAWAAPGKSNQKLFERLRKTCRRLAALGWRQMVLDATGGEFDLATSDLAGELLKPLHKINRRMAGFGDFNLAATRAIEPGHGTVRIEEPALARNLVSRRGIRIACPGAEEGGGQTIIEARANGPEGGEGGRTQGGIGRKKPQ